MSTTKNLLPQDDSYTIGNSSKQWKEGHFKELYDGLGKPYVHKTELDKFGLYIDEDGDICQYDE